MFELPELKSIAQKYGKTVAKVIIRWHLQRGIVVIPKLTHIERMEENFNVFDFLLSEEDMTAIAAIDKKLVNSFWSCLRYLLLCYSSKSFTNHRSDGHCNDHFAQIGRNERNDTDCKCCAYCISGLEAEPCCSKCVADCSSDDHSEDLDYTVSEFVNDNTCDDCHWNKPDDISAGRTCQFSQSACESGEYRKPYQSEQQVDQVTQSSLFPV